MSTSIRRINPPTLSTPRGYTHIVEARPGRTAYISGQVPLDTEGKLVGLGDLEAQTDRVFVNLRAALAAVGGNFVHVVKITIFVATAITPESISTIRAVRDRHIDPEDLPASSLLQVVALYLPNVLIEIEAIAVIPDAS